MLRLSHLARPTAPRARLKFMQVMGERDAAMCQYSAAETWRNDQLGG